MKITATVTLQIDIDIDVTSKRTLPVEEVFAEARTQALRRLSPMLPSAISAPGGPLVAEFAAGRARIVNPEQATVHLMRLGN